MKHLLRMGAFASAFLFGAMASNLKAASFTVSNTDDSGSGSLRQAILEANTSPGADSIDFAMSAHGRIVLTSGELWISDDLIVSGPGAIALVVDGGGVSRVFHIGSNTLVTISGLTISKGRARLAPFPRNNGSGGGILNDHGTLVVSHCTLSGNSALDFGGAIFNDGVDGSASLRVVNSTLVGNSAYLGGGIFNDGRSFGSAMLEIANTTVSGNSADGAFGGGGIFNGGYSGRARLRIVNSTFAGNDSTTDRNGGGGICNSAPFSGSSATLEIGSTIFSAGSVGVNILNVFGTISSLGYNLSSDNAGGVLTSATDQINTEPMLGPLQDNRGPTFTHGFLCHSAAIDQGRNFAASATDQRGAGFARTLDHHGVGNAADGDATDIGAFEAQAPLPICNQAPVAIIRVSPLAHLPGITNLVVIATDNGQGCVTLDASLSSDPDHDALTYYWFSESGPTPFASDVVVTNCLQLGRHTVRLLVTDPLDASGSAAMTVEVLSPAESVQVLVAVVDNAALERRNEAVLLAALKAATAAFDRGDLSSGLNHLVAFQNKVRARLARSHPALAEELLKGSRAIIEALR